MKITFTFTFILLANVLISFTIHNFSKPIINAIPTHERVAYIAPDVKYLNIDFTELDKTVFSVFSHGKPGFLHIEDQWLNAQQIATWLKQKQFIDGKSALHLYGCEFAKGEMGKKAIKELEEQLGIFVAASNDITGRDGDWVLEIGNPNTTLSIENYTANLCTDTDGDDICDTEDLDDDNDGIPDEDELPINNYFSDHYNKE